MMFLCRIMNSLPAAVMHSICEVVAEDVLFVLRWQCLINCLCSNLLFCTRCQLTPAGVKPATNDWLKKPLSEKHHTNSTAVMTTIPPAPTAAVASDADVSTFSLVSVGPYEDFAVSSLLCVCYFISQSSINL